MALVQTHSLRPTLTEDQTAEIVGVKANTLAVWRLTGKGPKFLKIGRAVRYSPDEIERYLASRECANTAQALALA